MIRFKEYLERRARRAAFMSVCLAGLTVFGGLFLGSCANEDLGKDNDKNGGDKGAAVTFNVSEAQEDAQAAAAKAMPGVPVTRAAFTEQLGMMNLTPKDLTTQKLTVRGNGSADLCLIETTTPGVNPVRRGSNTAAQTASAAAGTEDTEAATRANITTLPTLGHFSSIGYRGTTATGISNTPWFHDKDTNPDGTLVSPIYWSWQVLFGKFFAIAPREASSYARLKLSPDTHAGTPYVDFEVEPDVKNQKDLMTACSGLVHYDTPNVAPRTDLRFRHALTAVRFKVGQNLSYSKTITKVEIVGAKSKGRYTLSADETGTGAAWTALDAPATFTLGGDGSVNVSTSEAVNNIIMGKNNDNYTFYMIPQPLSGVQVKIYFDNSSAPAITANLSGTWKPGTTKTYALSQNNSDWQYQLTVTSPAAVAYDQTATGAYTITSYRTDPATSTQQPVKWKIVGYQESADGGATWSTESTTKPAWLSALTLEDGNGGTSAESGSATLTEDVIDHLAAYNKVLHDATPKGSAGNYYNLSNASGADAVENTANSYLISTPGYYRIPLVYGNAITGGTSNSHAYISQVPTGVPNEQYVLRHFKDHNGQDITNPWITQTNGGSNAPDGAKIVWTDQQGLVEASSLGLEGSGTSAFVRFRVPKDKIKNGNAVIAVTKGGTVVWSWHLWFDHDDVLETVACTNYQNKVYKFTKQTLGFAYRKWENTTYDKPRVIKVKVEQEIPNGGTKKFAYINITQNPGSNKEISTTLYQFGRKDALPGIDAIADGSFTQDGGNNMSIQNGIQHPETFYPYGSGWFNIPYFNLWSMDNVITYFNDNTVIKTIYDPCPAGFKMPASNAFTGFSKTGNNTSTPSDFNISGAWDYGYNFNNKLSSPDATVYFSASGGRNRNDGMLFYDIGFCWSAMPNDPDNGCHLAFTQLFVSPRFNADARSNGYSVRPVSE